MVYQGEQVWTGLDRSEPSNVQRFDLVLNLTKSAYQGPKLVYHARVFHSPLPSKIPTHRHLNCSNPGCYDTGMFFFFHTLLCLFPFPL